MTLNVHTPYHCAHQEGAILVFMPGWEQIKKTKEMLESNPLFTNGETHSQTNNFPYPVAIV